ncbi:hypothetical protein [Penaeicola halotolerans]|uniref:hypothetical protein n=1 Tax=Penaeicola halotolerans TaxID=2793196 RepID=UPI001CF8CC6F|nr:hypothetical protein [Penaeicola halotolerans]
MLEDRIENYRFEKNIKFFKWGAIITLLLAVFKVAFTPDILDGGGKMADFLLTLIPIGLFFQYRSAAKKWGGQFIEWKENEISFKSRKYNLTTIHLSNIESIDIRLDVIEIRTSEQKLDINIEDYTKYEDRIRVKDNFKKIKEKLGTSSPTQKWPFSS